MVENLSVIVGPPNQGCGGKCRGRVFHTLPLVRAWSAPPWRPLSKQLKRLMFRVSHRLRFIEPQLASPVDQPPEGKHWIHEVKHDGYRSQVVIERGQVRVFSRNGHDWSDRYPVHCSRCC